MIPSTSKPKRPWHLYARSNSWTPPQSHASYQGITLKPLHTRYSSNWGNKLHGNRKNQFTASDSLREISQQTTQHTNCAGRGMKPSKAIHSPLSVKSTKKTQVHALMAPRHDMTSYGTLTTNGQATTGWLGDAGTESEDITWYGIKDGAASPDSPKGISGNAASSSRSK
jgi:hypothetical protein